MCQPILLQIKCTGFNNGITLHIKSRTFCLQQHRLTKFTPKAPFDASSGIRSISLIFNISPIYINPWFYLCPPFWLFLILALLSASKILVVQFFPIFNKIPNIEFCPVFLKSPLCKILRLFYILVKMLVFRGIFYLEK